MKRILQAMDGVATKPVVGADSMARFLRVVSEADLNQPTAAKTPAVKVPPIPALPAQDGDQGNGEIVTANQDGTKSYSGAFGTFVYDASGKAIKYTTPSISGLGQTIDLTNNQTTQNYNAGPMNVTQTTDAKGNVVSSNSEYDLGVGKFATGKDAKGITSKAYTPAAGGQGEQGVSSKDIYALGNKDKEATYNRAMAQVNNAPVQENSLNKFLSIVDKNNVSILNESKTPHKVALPVQMAMQHYQQKETTPIKPSLGVSKYFHKVEEEIAEEQIHKRQLINQYASTIAERVLMKEGKAVKQRLDPKCWTGKHKEGTKVKGGVRVNNCVPNESVNEHEAGWSRHGQGPGMQDYVVDEAPLDFDKDVPMSSTIHSHKGVNPASIESRMMRARSQLQELAKMAEHNDPLAWQHIARLFPELAMNIEQIDHGLRQLGSIRRKGGRNSKNIPQHLDPDINETVLNTIKPKASTPKAIKPKAKTSTCRAGQTQTGMQIKDGKSVPKCSVTGIKK